MSFNLLSQNRSGGFIDTTVRSTSIPFMFINNLIVIPVFVNDNKDTLHFVLDSGIKPTLITFMSASMEFNVNQKLQIRGLGGGEDLDVYVSNGNKLFLGDDIKLDNQVFLILAYDKFELSKKMGIVINGIIGYTIFEKFILKIDFQARTITFYNRKYFKYKNKLKNWSEIPLTIFNGKPYTDVKVGISPDTVITAKVLVDLGASDAMWLFPNSDPNLPQEFPKNEYYLGEGLNGDIFGYQKRMSFVDIDGNYKFNNIIVSIPDTQSINVPEDYDMPGRNGTIGSEIFRRFDLLIDYQSEKMFIKKNKFYSDVFKYDLSGLEFQTPVPGLPYYTIYFVHEGSPAQVAGLKKDDALVSLNNESVLNLSLNDILMTLSSKEGRKVKIKVNREGKEFETSLILRNYKIQ